MALSGRRQDVKNIMSSGYRASGKQYRHRTLWFQWKVVNKYKVVSQDNNLLTSICYFSIIWSRSETEVFYSWFRNVLWLKTWLLLKFIKHRGSIRKFHAKNFNVGIHSTDGGSQERLVTQSYYFCLWNWRLNSFSTRTLSTSWWRKWSRLFMGKGG